MKENKRFYFRIDTANNEALEVYVGQNAGNQLNKDILSAKYEVIIVSPYIDESKIDDLINLKNRDVNVRLAFSDLRKKQRENVLQKLISQHKEVDVKKKEKVKKQIALFTYISVLLLSIAVFSAAYIELHLASREYKVNNTFALGAMVISLVALSKTWKKKKQIEKTDIYSYTYSEKLNFKFIRNNDLSKFIHSKIYIIDRKVAYLGSLNYTNNGFTKNFETRVRITQIEKVNELVDFVHEMLDDDVNFEKHELDDLGQETYNQVKPNTLTCKPARAFGSRRQKLRF